MVGAVTERVPACQGVAVDPPEIGLELGWLNEPPPHRVLVQVADAVDRAPDAELAWELQEPAAFGLPPITTQTWTEPNDRIWFGNTLNLALRIDHPRQVITIATKNGNRQVLLEALASVALPMVAQRHGAIVVHASSACLGDSAVLLCAMGGGGKSSLMVGLIGAGWQAISEDQCVIEPDETGDYRIWPGYNWVRFKQGVPPVSPVSERRFEAVDKVAWQLDGWMARAPARLDRIVFLEPPGGDEPLWEPVSSDDAITAVTRQSTWLHNQDSFIPVVLPQIVNLAVRVPAYRMRLPFTDDWLAHGIALLTGS